ncbi:class I SAM-dependent methyltransferase [Rufibacter sediminis]|uniref:class I SAM-dependent methyltransferase n=1 Tax=Rufibacter sediminis TaxID=2762756 RepID=UPI001886EAE4|nr:class I SAM-dependent methyltransferase [Rufibacter sediminis]
MPQNSTVLDLGCGTGIPISKVLLEEGMTVYGVDASPTLVNAFRQHFPHSPVICESVENSSFFQRKFDGVIAWGLLFLLPKQAQEKVIEKVSDTLEIGGKFLFTAPAEKTQWKDVLTGYHSISLGAKTYKEIVAASGLSLIEEFEDEGRNHYYITVKS